MTKSKKPAPKGGAKKCAPKKAVKRAPTVKQKFDRAAKELGARVPPPVRQTVEEQYEAELRKIPAPVLAKPSLWHRFRSAITGLFVSKAHAQANPHTTVKERVK